LIGVVSRLTHQKGLDVLASAMRRVLELDLQMVLLGAGDADAESFFRMASRARPDRFHAWIDFDVALAHRIEAGCDFFLMPSRYEPCGLNQMYSLRYGTLPIVRATGGLDDSVESYDEATGLGTGFKLHDLNPSSLYNVIGWAVSTWYDRPHHIEGMRRRAMGRDFSWATAAAQYEQVYRLAIERHAIEEPLAPTG
jgi:starch synthase